jgi:hypothetical protein
MLDTTEFELKSWKSRMDTMRLIAKSVTERFFIMFKTLYTEHLRLTVVDTCRPCIVVPLEFYEEAYFYNRRLTLTFKGMEARYR